MQYGHPDPPFVFKGTGQCIPVYSVASWAPANSTTYYFGSDTISTTPTVYSMAYTKAPVSGILKAVLFKLRITTGGSAELVQHFVRVNDTTDYALPSVAYNATTMDVFANNLAIPINAGDQIAIKVVTPAWVSAPLTLRPVGYLYIE